MAKQLHGLASEATLQTGVERRFTLREELAGGAVFSDMPRASMNVRALEVGL